MVVGNKNFTEVTKPSEIVQLLLNDDQLANLDSSGGLSAKQAGKLRAGDGAGDQARDLWNDEGDDFFGHSAAPAGASITEIGEEDKDPGTIVPVPKKRKGPTGAPRGRRPGSKNKPKDGTAAGPKKGDSALK